MNNAILAEERHLPLYKELVEDHADVEYIAGGATQNSMRVAQWISGRPNLTAMVGCIGNDDFGKQLETAAAADGVKTLYLKDEAAPTGTCAVCVHERERSLVANLSAANNYKFEHMRDTLMDTAVAKARFIYSSGFFLTVSTESMVAAGKHAAENDKFYMMNLAAPFLSAVFKDQMHQVLPYCDIVFGNESEGAAFAEANGMAGKPLDEVALAITRLPKASGLRSRMVIITQGADPVIVAKDGVVTHYPTAPIPEAEMVDFNGAGDAFVGGFVARFIENDDIASCVKCGQWASREIIKRSGCTFDRTVTYSASA